MSYSIVRYTGNGTTATYTFPFQYIDQDHVQVRVGGVVATFTFLSANAITISPPPASGSIIEIKRVTPKDTPPVNFTDGSILLERDLDLLATFELYLAQETADSLEGSIQLDSLDRFDAKGKRIINVAAPVDGTDAVNKTWAETAGTSFVNQATAQATAAAGSASAAATSASASATSASNSATSASNSASSATAGASSATAAAGSATGAASSATAAATSATNANTSALAAAASAASASGSATTATTQATNAASSAVSAANSAAAAATALDNFDDRYLGQKATDPALDNDGSPLITGALYYNTTDGAMRVYTGSGWINASSAQVATMKTFVYVATAAQTTFTGNDANGSPLTYVAPYLIVSLNGLELRPVADYMATSGLSVVLTTAATAGDELQIQAFSGFNVANIQSTNVSFSQGGTGSTVRSVDAKLKEFVSVKDFGAVGNGVADDLSKLILARDAAASSGKTLYFPDGVYGISDRFMFADGGHAYFMPGASLKLLGNTASGGAVSGPYPTQTKPIEVHNLTIDCNNIAGENGVGFGHIVGAKLINLTVRNVLHSPTIYGGKALQFEGAEATNVQVHGVNLENCSVGIDLGAIATEQSVHINITNVTMKNVDIPVHVNDTNTTTPSDSYDQMEVVIDGLHCRNCGKLTYSGATSTGGGIIVLERGYKVTVRNVQIVNDRGGYTSTAYGAIGALIRGQGRGIVLDNVLVDSDMVALFDFSPAAFQSPFGGDVASYVLASGIRHYGNLDYIVKCLPGGGKLGTGLMRGVEIGSTAATLAGLVDANAAAYSNTHLEVINRDNNFFSSGLRPLSKLNALGNALNGNTQGYPAPAQMQGSWTPTDASGAGLTFAASEGWWFRQGDLVVAMGQVTYPTTASGSSAKIGGLPFTVKNNLYARAGGVMTISTIAGAKRLYPETNGTAAPILSDTSGGVTNATCSGGIFAFTITYPAA